MHTNILIFRVHGTTLVIMTNTKFTAPHGTSLSAPFVVDGVERKIKLSSVEKVGAWVPATETAVGHYSEIQFELEPVTAQPVAKKARYVYGKSERTETAVDITNEHGHGEKAERVGLDTDY